MTLDPLDGVTVAPENHKVIFENEAVRVLETTIPAGERTPLHTHLAPTVMYVLSGSHFIRRDAHGATMLRHASEPGLRPAEGALRGIDAEAHDREHRVRRPRRHRRRAEGCLSRVTLRA